MINLASRRNANHLPSPGLQEQIDVDISSGLAKADRSLEEGEILEETPPAEMDKLYSHGERRLRSPSPHEIGQLRSSQYSNGTSDSRRSGDSYVTRPASRSSFLSPPTLRNVPERSVTPSPASSSGEFPGSLEALDRRPANGGSRYSQHRTPHRSNRPSSRPSTADSNDLLSRDASDPVRDRFIDDLSRTPRRTPAHRRYESELLPSEERPLDSRRSARGNESQSERSLYSARSHSSLDRYVESDRRSAYSTPFSRGERRDLHRSQRHDDRSSQQPEPSHYTPASGRLSSLYLDRSDRPEAQYSARSARSYTSSNHRSGQGAASQRSISPSASTRGINERPASIVGGRTTPRYTDRPASRVGTTRSSIAESQSIRSLAGSSIDNIDRYESRTRARTVSNRSTSDVDGVRSERQNDGGHIYNNVCTIRSTDHGASLRSELKTGS